MHVVFTSNIIVAAPQSWTDVSHAVLPQRRPGHREAVVSAPMVFEPEAVFLREEHREAMAMTVEEIGAFLRCLRRASTPDPAPGSVVSPLAQS